MANWGVPDPKTLFERVTFCLEYERAKHEKPHDHVENEVNRWTNIQLLERISEALEEMKTEELTNG